MTSDMPARGVLDPYDGILLVSFGGPEAPEEVLPFLRSVTHGKGIPDERLAQVGAHYDARGGRSPINDENRALVAALEGELARRGIALPVLWGNRHLRPSIADALREARRRGLRRLATVFTSAYSSYSSCRQYRENLADAVAELEAAGEQAPELDKLAPYGRRDAFVEPMARLTAAGVTRILARAGVDAGSTRLLFVTHSIPEAMDAASGPPELANVYSTAHREVAERISARVRELTGAKIAWELTYCSRSGPPSQAWLEPDVDAVVEALPSAGARAVVLAPIGFVADHMEVVYDLDEQASRVAREAGLEVVRVPTVRTDPLFVAGIVDLLLERAALARGETVDASVPGWLPPQCPDGCCANPRAQRPALCGGR